MQETTVALVDQIIPDINRSGVDDLGSGADDAGDDPTNEDETSNAVAESGIRVPIRVDNPNN